MARKRMISPSFWTDEKIGCLPVEARLLFMGLISNADDEGRLPGHELLVKSMVYPYDNFTPAKINEWLDMLSDKEMIVRYIENEQTFIEIENFAKHQTINRPTKSIIPECCDTSVIIHGALTEGSLNTHGALTPKRKEKKRKEKEEKVSFAEFVFMTVSEHEKLIDQFGEKETQVWIERLNLWKGANGKKTASDYLTILNWDRRRKDEQPKQTSSPSSDNYEHPDDYLRRMMNP